MKSCEAKLISCVTHYFTYLEEHGEHVSERGHGRVRLGSAESDEEPDAVAGDEAPLVEGGLVLKATVVLLGVVQHLRR